ncbi:DNA polymerase IV [Pseudoalteromonas denitrificans]|uniref:DNA polymerase IV n=1 Tax=Pseudoalteromonas denitrificans DSM 6059 TaxID=1123010 RepID=A0A1I1II42_9GAMM|nr:DNA polymerase IV [Pseudoalteromonas denitrificans]SFC36009.1 DNA polymerase-4 [Pseudoalteromonas denitrificans DSM 6059]
MKKFIHIDMDCFYAAVEMRDNPALREVPLAIGGKSRRGVISTSNYIARQYGVRSAMSNYKALQLCPHLVLVPGRMSVYKEASNQIREIFHQYTDLIEPLSLDEAYLDVTDAAHCSGSATLMAQEIRQKIYEKTGLTASAGVAPIKFIAKIASDENKPNGQCIITPDKVSNFLNELPLGKIPGVGKVTLERLAALQLKLGKDVLDKGEDWMVRTLSNFGYELYQKCAGNHIGKVHTERVRKSLSVEHTYEFDLNSEQECLDKFPGLLDELQRRLEKQNLASNISKLSVKVKFSDFVSTTADQTANSLCNQVYAELLKKAYTRGGYKGVRLLGVGVGIKLEKNDEAQLSFEC